MRYIPLKETAGPCDLAGNPNQDWLDRANALLQQLIDAPDHPARCAIIDANAQIWGELREWLLSLSNDKCWYSEARDVFSYLDVDHYRPKSAVKRKARGNEQAAYWWLAFDWRNFRICGQVGNRRKGIFFPLAPVSPEAAYEGVGINNEIPLLLDPTEEGDPELLSFNEDGSAVAHADAGEMAKLRVNETVQRLNLNYSRLKRARQRVWQRCWQLIEECRAIASINPNAVGPADREAARQKAAELKSMARKDAEFSAVAVACLMKSNIGWARQLACS
ncbi:MAG: hypothetical protein Tsb0026_04150 [Sulfuricaulis sp.]